MNKYYERLVHKFIKENEGGLEERAINATFWGEGATEFARWLDTKKRIIESEARK